MTQIGRSCFLLKSLELLCDMKIWSMHLLFWWRLCYTSSSVGNVSAVKRRECLSGPESSFEFRMQMPIR
ncbi:hypothetical protein ACOSQ2_004371 [Xanthoceras sorbifolium]